MIRLGITGGIGSGKSFVSRRLAAMGVPVYDTDSRARQLMTERAALRDSLTALVGEGVYLPDGQLDRPFLAAYLFADPTHTAAVNARVHPCVCGMTSGSGVAGRRLRWWPWNVPSCMNRGLTLRSTGS